jgi:hypothetical protein
MNKKLLYISLFIACLFHFHSVNAKSINGGKDSGLYISLNGGYLIPLGYFKSPIYSYPLGTGSDVDAMNGYGGSIGIEHPIRPGLFGLLFYYSYYENSYNLERFEELTSNDLGGYYISGGNSSYKESSYMGGIFFETKFKKITLELKSMIGLDFITEPYLEYTLERGHGTIWPILPEPFPGWGYEGSLDNFVYEFGISVRYAVVKHISICGTLSYLNNFFNNYNTLPTGLSLNPIPLSQIRLETGLAYHF